jgi:hypothetical protein
MGSSNTVNSQDFQDRKYTYTIRKLSGTNSQTINQQKQVLSLRIIQLFKNLELQSSVHEVYTI